MISSVQASFSKHVNKVLILYSCNEKLHLRRCVRLQNLVYQIVSKQILLTWPKYHEKIRSSFRDNKNFRSGECVPPLLSLQMVKPISANGKAIFNESELQTLHACVDFFRNLQDVLFMAGIES